MPEWGGGCSSYICLNFLCHFLVLNVRAKGAQVSRFHCKLHKFGTASLCDMLLWGVVIERRISSCPEFSQIFVQFILCLFNEHRLYGHTWVLFFLLNTTIYRTIRSHFTVHNWVLQCRNIVRPIISVMHREMWANCMVYCAWQEKKSMCVYICRWMVK
jgi:hypothetical protein